VDYPIKLRRDTNGTILVSFPDFPEAFTVGDDRDDARLRAIDALATAIQGRIADREDIPKPSKGYRETVRLPSQAVAKVLLYRTMRERNISKAELARRLRRHRPEVDRLLDLRHATRLEQVDAALASLGAHLDIKVKEDVGPRDRR